MKPRMRSVSFLAAIAVLSLLSTRVAAQGVRMQAHAGFGGLCKESEWLPVAVDIENRGADVSGELTAAVPNTDWRTFTSYRRPVVLGSQSKKRFFLYIRGRNVPGQLTANFRARRGLGAESQITFNVLSGDDTLIVVLGRERGALSFLSGTHRGVTREQRTWSPGSGVIVGPRQGDVRVADMTPGLLPDLAQAYQPVDLLVLGEVPAQDLRPEVKDALGRWVRAGGTIVVMGGPDWARLKDRFYGGLLPVGVTGAAEAPSLDSLTAAYGPGLTGPAVLTRAEPKAGAVVLLRQGDLPLVVEGAVGSGKVIFLAFDATRSPLREWKGQMALWNHLLTRAESTSPVLRAVSSGVQPYQGYGGYYPSGGESQLAQAVLKIPAMQTPPFWLVAVFLGAYVVVLIPMNYSILKWRRRRELAWVTTPAIVLLFAFLAYWTGYGMKGGRLLINQLSLIETQAGSTWAALTSYAGLFSPAKTSYDLTTNALQGTISEVDLSPQGQRGHNLSVVQTEQMSVPRVAMDMWAMRVFKVESLADLGGGIDADLTLGGGLAQGRVTNRAGFDLTDCEVHMGAVRQWLGELRDGASANVSLNIGAGQPAPVSRRQYTIGMPYSTYAPGPGASPSAKDMRSAVTQVLFGFGRGVAQQGGPVLTGWTGKRFPGLRIRGRSPSTTNLAFVIVHLPLRVASKGSLTVPYRVCESAVTQEVGVVSGYQPGTGITVGKGYVITEFRLPFLGASPTVERLEVFSDYGLPQHRHTTPIWGPVSGGPAGAAPASVPPPTDMSVHLYNWRTRTWDAMCYTAGPVMVRNPASYVRLPEGVVRAKFAHDPVRPGDDATLHQLDISATLRVK